MELVTFGSLLRQYRMASGLTQEALADRANLSSRAISDLERGINRVPRYTRTMPTRLDAYKASPRPYKPSITGVGRRQAAPWVSAAGRRGYRRHRRR